MIKAVVFDLDDTLYMEYEYVKYALNNVSQFISSEYNIENALSKLMKLYEIDRKQVFDRIISQENLQDAQALSKMLNVYKNTEIDHLTTNKGVTELLNSLCKKSIKLGIITDGDAVIQDMKIRALGIKNYFDKIIVTDTLGGIEYRKPNTKAFLLMASILGVEVDEMAYIGDNPEKDFVISESLPVLTIQYDNGGIYSQSNYSNGVLPKFKVNDFGMVEDIICNRKICG